MSFRLQVRQSLVSREEVVLLLEKVRFIDCSFHPFIPNCFCGCGFMAVHLSPFPLPPPPINELNNIALFR